MLLNMLRTCYLQSIEKRDKIIPLSNKILKVIGRNEETGIADTFLSKNQIELIADYENCCVKITPIGKSVSGCNGYALAKDNSYNLKHGDRIELRLGKHEFDIVFDPPPGINSNEIPSTSTKKGDKSNDNDNSPVLSQLFYNPISEDYFYGKNGTWKTINNDLVIYTPKDCKGCEKIAAFDMDGTLIKTKSGARFPKDEDDWMFLYNDIPRQLQKLHADGFKIVIFSNQFGLIQNGGNSKKMKEIRKKIESIIDKINLPIQAFLATQKKFFRKPLPGMWQALEMDNNYCDSIKVEINKNASIYVGDAAGREKNWMPKRPKDHSKADRLFAINLGLKFYTPEEFFLKSSPAPFKMPEFDPRSIFNNKYPNIDYEKQNVVIMVGMPGSGKSHFCKQLLKPKGYVHVSRDILGSWQKCVTFLESHLKNGMNVVIDNTNGEKSSRQRYIEIAKKFGVDCRCFWMETSLEHAKHNNKFRQLVDPSHVPVSDIVIYGYNKHFEQPVLDEGFVEIVKIPFVFDMNKSEYEQLYKMFLLES